MTTFDLNKFQKGAIAKTKGGQTAKFLAVSRGRLIVAFKDLLNSVTQETYQLDGRKYPNVNNPFDLVEMV